MPLIVITGIPSSGKTRRTLELKSHFEKEGKQVEIISEYEEIKKAGFEKNSFYEDSQKEKQIRGLLKSEVLRLIRPDNVVILDGSNYIKGYRYELYCATKANSNTQCTVHCLTNKDIAFEFNINRESEEEKYSKDVFDALLMRYEYPEPNNRWDSPLYVIQVEDELDFEAISASLFKKKPPPPNMSTQNAPLSDTNFLYELDKLTLEVTQILINGKTLQIKQVRHPSCPDAWMNISKASVPMLNTLRRQYVNYAKLNPPEVKKILPLYVQFLIKNLPS